MAIGAGFTLISQQSSQPIQVVEENNYSKDEEEDVISDQTRT